MSTVPSLADGQRLAQQLHHLLAQLEQDDTLDLRRQLVVHIDNLQRTVDSLDRHTLNIASSKRAVWNR
jgi:hypothetical protein